MMCGDEETFLPVGAIHNPLPYTMAPSKPYGSVCDVQVPARINTFLCKTQYFENPSRQQIYPVGSINFTVGEFTRAIVQLNSSGEFDIETGPRAPVLRHVALILKQVLGFDEGLTIRACNSHSVAHGGLGSTGALMSSVALAINAIYGNPLPLGDLARFVTQNYGEENKRDPSARTLRLTGCIGGVAAAGTLASNTIVVGGECEIWAAVNLPEGYRAVLAMPRIPGSGPHDRPTGFRLLTAMGKQEGDRREALLQNEILPDLRRGVPSRLFTCVNAYSLGDYGDVVGYFHERWRSYGVDCRGLAAFIRSRILPRMSLDTSCFFVSSDGPLHCVVTRNHEEIASALRECEAFESVWTAPLHASGPQVVLR